MSKKAVGLACLALLFSCLSPWNRVDRSWSVNGVHDAAWGQVDWDIEGNLKDWKYPGIAGRVNLVSSGKLDLQVGMYTTSDSFRQVWDFYNKKVGTNTNFWSGPGVGASGVGYNCFSLNSRPGIESAMFFKRTEKHTICIAISRVPNDDKTHITISGAER